MAQPIDNDVWTHVIDILQEAAKRGQAMDPAASIKDLSLSFSQTDEQVQVQCGITLTKAPVQPNAAPAAPAADPAPAAP